MGAWLHLIGWSWRWELHLSLGVASYWLELALGYNGSVAHAAWVHLNWLELAWLASYWLNGSVAVTSY
eukprot:67061-Pelagomonas_calceolata.AAC.1